MTENPTKKSVRVGGKIYPSLVLTLLE